MILKVFKKLAVTVLIAFLTLVQGFGPTLAIAQEVTSEPTPKVTESPSPEPSQTPQPEEISTPSPEPSTEISPSPTPIESGPTDSPSPVPTPTQLPALESPSPSSTPNDQPQQSIGESSPQVPTQTPEPVSLQPVMQSTQVWQDNGDGTYTTAENVTLNKVYIAPFPAKLALKFTKLPTNARKITIREIAAEFNTNVGKQVGEAYEITSDMADGTFLYDLTLPLPIDQQGNLEGTEVKAEKTQVAFSEDGQNFEISQNEKSINTVNHDITIKNLNHFTVFVLVNDISSITNGMLTTIKDAWLDEAAANQDVNHGNATTLQVQSRDAGRNQRALVQFDLPSIPAGSTINNAKVRLYMTAEPSSNRTYQIYRITPNDWTEGDGGATNTPTGEVSWDNLDGGRSPLLSFAGSPTSSVNVLSTDPDGWVEFDVASDITAFLSGTPNYGWIIKDSAETESSTARTITFASKENGTDNHHPQLSVDFTQSNNVNGFNSPLTHSSVTGTGDGDGYLTNPSNAFAADETFAVDTNSGATVNNDCTTNGVDRHMFNNYGFSVPVGATVNGIEVRQDLKVDSLTDSPFTCVELSWNGGSTWTSIEQTSLSSTNLTPYYFGGATYTWGRTWSASDFSNANFKLRVSNGDTDNGASTTDFSLDWIPVRVYFTPDTTAPSVSAGSDITANSQFNRTGTTSDSASGINNSSISWTKSSGPGTITFGSANALSTTISASADGLYVIQLSVSDNAGNTQTSSFTLTWDQTAPSISITNPNTSPAQSKTITASTNEGTLTMSNTTGSTCDGTLAFVSYSSQTFTSESDNGKKVCYKATDTANNTTYNMSSTTAGIDTTPPVSTGTPTVSTSVKNNKPTWNWTSTDASVDHYIFYWDSIAGGEASSSANLAAGTVSFTHSTALADGTWYVKVKAFDSAGNSSTSGNGTVTINTTPVTITPAQLQSSGVFSVPSTATTTDTPSATALVDTTINVAVSGGASSVLLPTGTVMTRTDGTNLDTSLLSASDTSASSLSGLGTGVTIDGAFQWGIPNIGLTFSQPITLKIYVGASFNGQTLNVVKSNSTSSGWTSNGIVAPATCFVASGLCTFQATSASYYATTHTVATSGGGGGNDGGDGLGCAAHDCSVHTTPQSQVLGISTGPATGFAPEVLGISTTEGNVGIGEVKGEATESAQPAQPTTTQTTPQSPFNAKIALVVVVILILGFGLFKLIIK